MVLLMLLGLAAPAMAQYGGSIDPGERIDFIELGMPASRALGIAAGLYGTAMGAQDCTSAEERSAGQRCVYRVWWMTLRPLQVIGVEAHGPVGEERVEMALTSNAAHVTEEDVGPGVRLDRFVQAYGPPPVTGERFVLKTMRMAVVFDLLGEGGAWWPARGLGVVYQRQSRIVQRVHVFGKQ